MTTLPNYHRTFRVTRSTIEVRKGFAAAIVDAPYGPAFIHYEDQDFTRSAVPWEVTYMNPLKRKNSNPFIPLMTRAALSSKPSTPAMPEARQGWTPGTTFPAEIVGYAGWVQGWDIWTRDLEADQDWKVHMPDGALELGGQLPVTAYYQFWRGHELSARDRGWKHFPQWTMYQVICSVHGEILTVLDRKGGNNGQAIPVDGPEILLGGIVKKIATPIVKRVITVGVAAGRRTFVKLLSKKIAKRIRPVNGKVNVGGGFEAGAQNCTNLNPIVPGTGGPGQSAPIPNHVRAGFEEIGDIFESGSVREIISNRLPFQTVKWDRAAAGAFKVMAKDGKLSLNVWTRSQEQVEALLKVFRDAGFKDVGLLLPKSAPGPGTIVVGIRP